MRGTGAAATDPARRASSNARATFRAQDVFQCPELDVRMKKYLVRLANETANHLIRDTLEPNGDAARFGANDNDDNGNNNGTRPHGYHANDKADDDDDGQVDARAAATNGLVWKKLSVVRGIQILRGYDVVLAADHAKDVAARSCLRGLSEVNASIEEFALLFKLDSTKQHAEHGLLFNPDLVDAATLYALVLPSGAHPRRYVGIKWCRVQSPSKLFRDRDFCYLECQKEFRDAQGRRGWVRSLHSIKMPCCPTLEATHSIVRASLYRCGLTVVESAKPGVLHVTYTVEMDLKGHFPELFQPTFIAQRIATLASIDRYLQQQRLSSTPLLGDLDLPDAATANRKTACHLCYRPFSAVRNRRVACRKCGQSICKSCSSMWALDVPGVVGTRDVRICTVCSADARHAHVAPRSTTTTTQATAKKKTKKTKQTIAPAATPSSDLYHLRDFVGCDNRQPPLQPQPPRRRTSVESVAPPLQSFDSDNSSVLHTVVDLRYDPYRATFETQRDTNTSSDTAALFDAFGAPLDDDETNVRQTTDLTNLWDRPPDVENELALAVSTDAEQRRVKPQRGSILFDPRPTQQQAPSHASDATVALDRQRQSDFSWDKRRRDAPTNDRATQHAQRPPLQRESSIARHSHRPSAIARFGYDDHRPLPLRTQSHAHNVHHHQPQRRRQQSVATARPPREPVPEPVPPTRDSNRFRHQRDQQQSTTDAPFVARATAQRNFALEFFHDQYLNNHNRNPQPPSSTAASRASSTTSSDPSTLLSQSYRRRPQRPQSSPFDRLQQTQAFDRFERPSTSSGRSPSDSDAYVPSVRLSRSQSFDSLSFHSRSFESFDSFSSQQSVGRLRLPMASPDRQTPGEVIEYVETPEGEWIEQRLTIDAIAANRRRPVADANDVDEEELLHPGFCIHCGAKCVRQFFGAIDATCACDVSQIRRPHDDKEKGMGDRYVYGKRSPPLADMAIPSRSGERTSDEVDSDGIVMRCVTQQFARQSLQANAHTTFSTYSA